jgi:hypothetical protein
MCVHTRKGPCFISNRQRRKHGTFCASELAGIKPTPPAPEEQGMPAFANQARGGEVLVKCCAPLAVPGAESLRGAALPLARRVGKRH